MRSASSTATRSAAPGEMERRRQAGEPAADDRDVHRDIALKRSVGGGGAAVCHQSDRALSNSMILLAAARCCPCA